MKQTGIFILIQITLASIVISGFLFFRLRSQYERHLIESVWSSQWRGRPIASQSDCPDKILLLGDSRVADWGQPKLGNSCVINAGQTGATTSQLRLGIREWLDTIQPNVVVVEVGINDLKLLGLRPELSPALISEVVANISEITAECSARGCKVFLLEVWTTNRPDFFRRFVWNQAIPRSIPKVNERLRGLHSPSKGVYVVDLWNNAAIKLDQKTFSDTLHIRPEAYSRLTAALERTISGTHSRKP